MGLTFPQLLAGAIGALLIYAALKKETPVEVVKKALASNAAPPATPAANVGDKPPVAEPKAAKYA